MPIPAHVKSKLLQEFGDSSYSDSETTTKYVQNCSYILKAENKSVLLYVCLVAKRDCPPKLLLLRALRRVETLLLAHGCSKKLTYWLIPTRATRRMPCKKELVSAKHINGGFTYPSKNEIFIYRAEEFPKVMLHEAIHHLPLDTSKYWDVAKTQQLYSMFQIDATGCPHTCTTSLNPNEAIVETWAELYQMLFLSNEYNLPFAQLWDFEKHWAMRQACKILRKQKDMNWVWKEETHAYSYIVLRAMLLWKLPEFIRIAPERMPELMPPLLGQILMDSAFREELRKCESKATSSSSLRMSLLGDM